MLRCSYKSNGSSLNVNLGQKNENKPKVIYISSDEEESDVIVEIKEFPSCISIENKVIDVTYIILLTFAVTKFSKS